MSDEHPKDTLARMAQSANVNPTDALADMPTREDLLLASTYLRSLTEAVEPKEYDTKLTVAVKAGIAEQIPALNRVATFCEQFAEHIDTIRAMFG